MNNLIVVLIYVVWIGVGLLIDLAPHLLAAGIIFALFG